MGKWFRTRIREARERSGLSQGELGQILGISRMTLWNWENGESEPREEQYARVVTWIETVEGGTDVAVAAGKQEQSTEGHDETRGLNGASVLSEVDVPSDERTLLALIPSDGSAVTNLSLVKKLEARGWKEAKYWRVRDRLLDSGAVIRGRGRGGSVRRRVAESQEQPSGAKLLRAPVTEVALYAPLMKVLQTEWAREMRIEPHQIHFEETAKQGKKATGGTWTRPDITAVSVRSFPHLPNKYLDIWTFEAKTVDWLDVTAIFEAAAHASRATRSYALLQVPENPDDRTSEILSRCEREATRLRVGLITFVDSAEFSTWETVVEAPRIDTDPELLEQFIATLSDAARKRLSQWK